MAKSRKQAGFSHIELLIILVVIGVIVTIGLLVFRARGNDFNSNTTATKTGQVTSTKKAADANANEKEQSQQVNIDGAPEGSEAKLQINQPAPTFAFVDTTSWQLFKAKSDAFSIRYQNGLSYGYCKQDSNTLLLGMVFLNGYDNYDYDCPDLKGAVSVKDLGNNTHLLMTRVAFGPAESLWDRHGAIPINVVLGGGDKAERYDYSSVIDGKSYRTIEYVTDHIGKKYTALMHWDINEGVSGIPVADFDTIVQKTWSFN